MASIQVTGSMCGAHQTRAAPPSGELQWLQYHHPATGGRRSPQQPYCTATAASVHPLVPLLLCSHRHLPPPSRVGLHAVDAARSGMPARCHGDGISRQVVKKPLNAFMLFMKETRRQVQQEGGEKESAAINRILGRRWNAMSHTEQSKYYELARRERLLHLQRHPGWTARDNYGKKKKKKKKSAARSGLDLLRPDIR